MTSDSFDGSKKHTVASKRSARRLRHPVRYVQLFLTHWNRRLSSWRLQ